MRLATRKKHVFFIKIMDSTSPIIPFDDVDLNSLVFSKPKIFGLVFVYPENSNFDKGKYVEFSHTFKEVKIDIKNFDFFESYNPNKVQTNREKYVLVSELDIYEGIYIKL